MLMTFVQTLNTRFGQGFEVEVQARFLVLKIATKTLFLAVYVAVCQVTPSQVYEDPDTCGQDKVGSLVEDVEEEMKNTLVTSSPVGSRRLGLFRLNKSGERCRDRWTNLRKSTLPR